MTERTRILNDLEKNNVDRAVEFLVPYVHSIVKLSSEVDVSTENFKNKIENLYMSVDSSNNSRIEASASHNNFKFSLLYTGVRSFVLKINGYRNFDGFTYMETNKGMNIHDDLNTENEHISTQIMNQFLKYYKSPYLITETYKSFIKEGKSFI